MKIKKLKPLLIKFLKYGLNYNHALIKCINKCRISWSLWSWFIKT